MSDEPKKTVGIDGLQMLLEAGEDSAVTILPDGTVLIDEEKRLACRADMLTRRLDMGSTY